MKKAARLSIKVLIGIVLLILALYFGVWAFSPWAISQLLQKPLSDRGLTLGNETAIRYNPFLTRLTLNNLVLLKESREVLSVKDGEAELHLHRLWERKIYVEQLNIREANLRLVHQKEVGEIAGFDLSTEAEKKPQQQNRDSKAKPLTLPYRLVAPAIRFENITVDIQTELSEHQFRIKQFEVTELDLDQTRQTLKLAMEASVHNSRLAIQSAVNLVNNEGGISSTVLLESLPFEPFNGYFPALPGPLKGRLALALEVAVPLVDSRSGEKPQLPDLRYITTRLVNITGAASVKDFRLSKKPSDDLLTEWDNLALENLQLTVPIDSPADQPSLQIGNITVDNITSLRRAGDGEPLPALSTVNRLTLKTISYKDNTLSLDSVIVDGIYKHILLNKDKSLATLVAIEDGFQDQGLQDKNGGHKNSQSTRSPDVTNEKISPAGTGNRTLKKLPVDIGIREIVFSGENRVYFRDQSVSPTYERTITIDELIIRDLDTRSQNPVTFSLSARSSDFSKINLTGKLSPFTEKVNLHVEGSLNEISLPGISAYARDSLNFEVKNGDLDAIFDVTVEDSQLQGNATLTLRSLKTSSAPSAELNDLQQQTPIPLNLALDLLKNRQGNIILDVPVKGGINDPQFGMKSFILLVTRKATMMQARRYLLRSFVPYADVVSIALSAGDMVMKLRFEDLLFVPGQVVIDEAQSNYMNQFIALMKDKSKAQVKVCGVATIADAKGIARGAELSRRQQEQLLAIAQKRGESFKSYVVNTGQIESSRILSCQPQVDLSENALPRIEVSV